MLALVSALEPLGGRIAELTAEIREALLEHPDGPTRSKSPSEAAAFEPFR